MQFLLLLSVVSFGTCQGVFLKCYTASNPDRREAAPIAFTIASGIIVPLVTFLFFSGFRLDLNRLTLLLGVINGVIVYAYNYFLVKATAKGPYSIVITFLQAGGILIPIISSLLMGWDSWNGSAALWIVNAVSLAFIIIAIYMVSIKRERASFSDRKARVKFILYSVGVGVFNGLSGTLVTLQQRLDGAGGADTRDEFIIVKYLSAAIIATVVGIFSSGGGKFITSLKQNSRSLLFLILAPLTTALSLNLFAIAVSYVPTTILYTFNSSVMIILSALISAIFFKEKLSKMNVVGLILISAALSVISLGRELFT